MSKRQGEEDLEIGDAPTEIDPYAVLAVPNDASQDDIKKAYRRAALKYHPDKAAPEDKESAHTKFQEIAFAFAILSDERRRKRYDTTGRTEESLGLEDDDFDWTTYFRDQFQNVVTHETINAFASEYKGSEEEAGHVLEAYTQTKGSMEALYNRVMLSDMLEDEERFREIIDAAIARGEVESFKKYAEESETSRRKRMDRARKQKDKESTEAKRAAQEIEDGKAKGNKGKGNDNIGDLAALIQQRQKGRADNFFDGLEAKYGSKSKKGGKKHSIDEPPEEAFAANRKMGKAGDMVEGGKKSKRLKK